MALNSTPPNNTTTTIPTPIDKKWPAFNPFVRHPTNLLGKLKMALFGSILVPIRVVGALSTLTCVLLWCNICSLGCDPTKPYSPIRGTILMGGARVFARTLLFFYGFPWVYVTYVKGDEQQQAAPPAPIIVCNHLGFAETLYLLADSGCCFISKGANRSLPFIGRVIEVIQCVQVFRRPDSDSTAGGGDGDKKADAPPSATQIVLDRAKDPPNTWPPLATFPEGTTTNGRALIDFRTGAFRAGTAVQPVVVKMPFSPIHGYDPTFTCGNIFHCVLGLMTQPMNHMHVTHLPIYTPTPAEQADPRLYADNVQKKMAEAMGVETLHLSYVDKMQYEPSNVLREKGRKMLMEENGGVAPDEPVFTEDLFGRPIGGCGGGRRKKEV